MNATEKLRAAGFDEGEINEYILQKSTILQAAGFSDEEINQHFGIKAPPINPDVSPFDFDLQVQRWIERKPMEDGPKIENDIFETVYPVIRPFLAQGATTAQGVNMALGTFVTHMDELALYVEKKTGLKSSRLFENMADTYKENETFWSEQATKYGANAVDQFIGEAVGGAVPGVGEFALNVPWAALLGAAETPEGESEIKNALIEGMKRKTLGMIFEALGPLKQYLKAPTMGTVFGIQAATEAPEGKRTEAFGKGFATGALYSLSSPGGQMGLNELRGKIKTEIARFEDIKIQAEEIKENRALLNDEQYKELILSEADRLYKEKRLFGFNKQAWIEEALKPPTEIEPTGVTVKESHKAIGEQKIEGETRPRKFLKTVEESMTTQEATRQGIKNIDPQDYIVQPNKESLERAQNRITAGVDDAVNYVLSKSSIDAEKGATFISLAEKFQREGQLDKAVEMIEAYDRQLREAGRFVQAASLWNRLTPNGFVRWAEKEVNRAASNYGWVDSLFGRKRPTVEFMDKVWIMTEMTGIQKMPEGQEKTNATLSLIDRIAKRVPPSASEMIDAYRYQNMLSNPRTQMRNIVTNILNTFVTRPADITTKGAIDFIKSTLTGSEREAYVLDVANYYKSALNAFPNAWNAAGRAFRLQTEMGKPEMGIETRGAFALARARQMPKILTLTQRFMEASDKFNAALIAAGEYSINLKNGIAEPEAYARAQAVAQKYLFREKLSLTDKDLSIFSRAIEGIGEIAISARGKPGILGTAAAWYVPFIRTPMNVGIQMIEHSPLGFARYHGFELEQLAKPITGSLVAGIGALFALQGETTWAAPTNGREREWFYATGRKPFSVRIGDKWIPALYLGPFALAFLLPTAIKFYYEDSKQSLTQSQFEKIIYLAGGVVKFIGSQTSIQSIGNLFDMLSGDQTWNLPKQAVNLFGQFIPAQGMLRWIATMIDPIYRQSKEATDTLIANIPFWSKTLPAYQKPYGEESQREFINSLLPYDLGTFDKDYNEVFPMIELGAKSKYLQNALKEIGEKEAEDRISSEEADRQRDKLLEGYDKIIKELPE